MNNIKFIKQKAFEKLDTFEKRIQELSGQGWKAKNFTSDHGRLIVMLERER